MDEIPHGLRAMLPSAHDVARGAGVSQATVSRAFTPGASISPAAKAKVLRVADELGYRPNLLARSLIMGRSGIVGVVVGDSRNPFYMDAFDALSQRLAAAGLQMLVFTAHGSSDADIPVEDLLKYRVDAVVLMSAHLSSRLADRCAAEDIQVIFFNRRASSAVAASSVTGANAEGAGRIAEHLLAQGYRRLAFMAGSDNSSTSHEREQGFIERLAASGLAPPIRIAGHFERTGACEAMRHLMQMGEPPDAIFCANDAMAIAAIEVARFEFGLVPGRDVAIAGFDDIDQAAWPSFGLTTYSQPVGAMTDLVVALLADKQQKHSVVPGALVVRSSTIRAT